MEETEITLSHNPITGRIRIAMLSFGYLIYSTMIANDGCITLHDLTLPRKNFHYQEAAISNCRRLTTENECHQLNARGYYGASDLKVLVCAGMFPHRELSQIVGQLTNVLGTVFATYKAAYMAFKALYFSGKVTFGYRGQKNRDLQGVKIMDVLLMAQELQGIHKYSNTWALCKLDFYAKDEELLTLEFHESFLKLNKYELLSRLISILASKKKTTVFNDVLNRFIHNSEFQLRIANHPDIVQYIMLVMNPLVEGTVPIFTFLWNALVIHDSLTHEFLVKLLQLQQLSSFDPTVNTELALIYGHLEGFLNTATTTELVLSAGMPKEVLLSNLQIIKPYWVMDAIDSNAHDISITCNLGRTIYEYYPQRFTRVQMLFDRALFEQFSPGIVILLKYPSEFAFEKVDSNDIDRVHNLLTTLNKDDPNHAKLFVWALCLDQLTTQIVSPEVLEYLAGLGSMSEVWDHYESFLNMLLSLPPNSNLGIGAQTASEQTLNMLLNLN